MKQWWSNASIRVRLTAWYMAVLTLMLVVYATATFVAVRHEFQEQLEDQMRDVAQGTNHGLEAEAEDHLQRQLREILVVLVTGLPLVVGLAGIGGYVLARGALVPIDHPPAEARGLT